MKVLLVHGINNERSSRHIIESTWELSLRSGALSANLHIPEKLPFKAAFYGDVLFEETANWNKIKPAVRPMSSHSPDEDYISDDIASLYVEFQNKLGITDSDVANELENSDDRGSCRRMAKGVHKKWIKALARIIEKTSPSNGRYVAKYFLPQAAAYLYKPGLKEKIDNLVSSQIFADLSENEDILIISHSLGTIVAYSLLRALSVRSRTRLFLTAGSPLGIEIVKHRLGQPLIFPENVQKWVNASDREDFVALQPELDTRTFGCGDIFNIAGLNNGAEDPHDILKYLAQQPVVTEIVGCI